MESHGDVFIEIQWETHGKRSLTICDPDHVDEFDPDLRS